MRVDYTVQTEKPPADSAPWEQSVIQTIVYYGECCNLNNVIFTQTSIIAAREIFGTDKNVTGYLWDVVFGGGITLPFTISTSKSYIISTFKILCNYKYFISFE